MGSISRAIVTESHHGPSLAGLLPDHRVRGRIADRIVAVAAGAVHAVRGSLGLPAPAAAPHGTDFWLYGVAPVVVCAALARAAIATWRGLGLGPMALAASLLALPALAIRNAWDRITWIAPRRDADPPEGQT